MTNHNGETPPPDPETRALREIEAAKADIREAREHPERAPELEGDAVHRLTQAEEELERRRPIHIWVDGEEYEPKHREMTPDQIIREFGGGISVATSYLKEIAPLEISFQGNGNVPIELRNGEKFMILSLGPAPVSDAGVPRVGAQAFVAGLVALGFAPQQIEKSPDRVFFDYEVPAGSRVGAKVRIGIMIPPDFPMTPPSGVFVSPRILPISGGGGVHPTGGVHAWNHFDSVGGEWEYWSRPFSQWNLSRRTVAAYMAHVFKLWATL